MDEPRDDHALRDRLQRLADAMPASVAADPVPAIRDRLRRRRQRRIGTRLGALAAVALLVVTVVALDRRGDDSSGLDVVGPPSTVDAPPPPLEPSPVRLWLSATRVPPGDHDLVAILVNERDDDTVFGVGAAVDRWDGERWVPHRLLALCLDHWSCTAEMHPLDRPPLILDIGLGARPDHPGETQRFTVAGLDAGWYRIRQTANSGTVAAAILQIANEAPVPPPLWPLDRPSISISPSLLPPRGGQPVLLPLLGRRSGATSAGDYEAATAGLAERAFVQRWSAGRWATVGEPVTLTVPQSAGPGRIERAATIPPLPEGDYRLVRDGPDGEHTGRFWIADTTPVAPDARLPSQGEWVLETLIFDRDGGVVACGGLGELPLPPNCAAWPLRGFSWDSVDGENEIGSGSSRVRFIDARLVVRVEGDTLVVVRPPERRAAESSVRCTSIGEREPTARTVDSVRAILETENARANGVVVNRHSLTPGGIGIIGPTPEQPMTGTLELLTMTPAVERWVRAAFAGGRTLVCPLLRPA